LLKSSPCSPITPFTVITGGAGKGPEGSFPRGSTQAPTMNMSANIQKGYQIKEIVKRLKTDQGFTANGKSIKIEGKTELTDDQIIGLNKAGALVLEMYQIDKVYDPNLTFNLDYFKKNIDESIEYMGVDLEGMSEYQKQVFANNGFIYAISILKSKSLAHEKDGVIKEFENMINPDYTPPSQSPPSFPSGQNSISQASRSRVTPPVSQGLPQVRQRKIAPPDPGILASVLIGSYGVKDQHKKSLKEAMETNIKVNSAIPGQQKVILLNFIKETLPEDLKIEDEYTGFETIIDGLCDSDGCRGKFKESYKQPIHGLRQIPLNTRRSVVSRYNNRDKIKEIERNESEASEQRNKEAEEVERKRQEEEQIKSKAEEAEAAKNKFKLDAVDRITKSVFPKDIEQTAMSELEHLLTNKETNFTIEFDLAPYLLEKEKRVAEEEEKRLREEEEEKRLREEEEEEKRLREAKEAEARLTEEKRKAEEALRKLQIQKEAIMVMNWNNDIITEALTELNAIKLGETDTLENIESFDINKFHEMQKNFENDQKRKEDEAAEQKRKEDEAAEQKRKEDEAAEQKRKEDEAAEQKRKTDEAARLAAEEKRKTDEAARLAAEEKQRREAAQVKFDADFKEQREFVAAQQWDEDIKVDANNALDAIVFDHNNPTMLLFDPAPFQTRYDMKKKRENVELRKEQAAAAKKQREEGIAAKRARNPAQPATDKAAIKQQNQQRLFDAQAAVAAQQAAAAQLAAAQLAAQQAAAANAAAIFSTGYVLPKKKPEAHPAIILGKANTRESVMRRLKSAMYKPISISDLVLLNGTRTGIAMRSARASGDLANVAAASPTAYEGNDIFLSNDLTAIMPLGKKGAKGDSKDLLYIRLPL